MKTFILLLIALLFTGKNFAQSTGCNSLGLGEPYDSIDVVKKTIETYLQTSLKMSSDAEVKTMYDFKDKEDLNLLKVWLKQKKVAAGGSINTFYAVSSYRVTGVAENIQSLFNAMKEKVSQCSTSTSDLSFSFAGGKVFIEKQGGDWSKKNLQMASLTVTSAK